MLDGLGTDAFIRLRIGIDPPGRPVGEGTKYLLAPFKRAQKQEVDEVVSYAAEAVESILAEGAEKAMTKFNRRAQGLKSEEE